MTKTVELAFPEIGAIAATRAMLGVGIGLLAAGRISDRSRRAAGRALLAVGALSTIPLLLDVLSKRR